MNIKMKRIMVLALLVSVAFISCKDKKQKEEVVEVEVEEKVVVTETEGESFNVITETSALNWVGKKPTGSHNGTVAVKEGDLSISNGNLTAGTVTFDMGTIDVLDIPAEEESYGKLVGHLKSPDFFDVTANPTSTFKITEVVNGESMTVKGDLTIKGITKSIEFPASLKVSEGTVMLTAETFTIDRTEFDIKYKSSKFFDNLKDKFINDDFEISFVVNASK